MKLVDELRHLDGLKGGGIAVSETEYMATTILHEAEPLSQVIYSNVREIVSSSNTFLRLSGVKQSQPNEELEKLKKALKEILLIPYKILRK